MLTLQVTQSVAHGQQADRLNKSGRRRVSKSKKRQKASTLFRRISANLFKFVTFKSPKLNERMRASNEASRRLNNSG